MLLAAVGPAVKVYGGQAGNAQPSSSLPFTGFDLRLLAAGGLAILALGLLLRLYGRRTATKQNLEKIDASSAGEVSTTDNVPETTDPLTLAVNRAFNTGEIVSWTEGDPLPDPGGPVKPLPDEAQPSA